MFGIICIIFFAGSEYFLSVEPVLVEGEEDLLNVAHEKRSCFFQVVLALISLFQTFLINGTLSE